jgi:sucrose-6-phosphate hydrolase SacC (GH32 family)
MQFQPLTEEEIHVSALLPEGVYSYSVLTSEEKTSLAGNQYIALVLKAWNDEGRQSLIYSNLSFIKLLKHFCDVNDMQEQYKSGLLDPMSCMGKGGGRILVGVEGEKQNPSGGMYKAKNIVKDYILEPVGSPYKPLGENKKEFIDDDIPF